MDGLRGPAEFWTSGKGLEEQDLMSEDTQDFHFRSKTANSMIVLRVNSSDPVYIHLSSQMTAIRNDLYIIELSNGSYSLYNLWKSTNKTLEEFKAFPSTDEDHLDFMLAFHSHNMLRLGSWFGLTRMTHADYNLTALESVRFIGFSSAADAFWRVQNGNLVSTSFCFDFVYSCPCWNDKWFEYF